MGRFLRWTLLLVLVSGAGFWIWRASRPEPIEVALKAVDRGVVEKTVSNTRAGTVKACRRAKLSTSAGGQIARLPVKEGDRVSEGQLLLELWNEDLRAQRLLAEREVAAARAALRSVCIRADVSRRNADRLKQLRKSAAAAEDAVDRAVAEADALRAQCDGARTEVGVREARLAAAAAALERTRLIAPFDGVVAEINAERFEIVTPSPVGIPTPPAVDIIDTSCFDVIAPIDEVDAAVIRVGMTARISLDAFPDRSFAGRVRRIADYVLDVEKQARTVDVEVAFSEIPDGVRLLAGYSADIEVILDVRPDVTRVPTEAVVEGKKVYLFRPAEARVQERPVRTGLSNWDWTEVLEGPSPGEMVVVNVDKPGLVDGAAAVPMQEAP